VEAEAALKALAHPTRRRLLELVAESERPSSELAERCALSKPAASQHLRVLKNAELVEVRPRGHLRLYRARAERLAELRAFLDEFWSERLGALRTALEP
jgi:DNA-binding transcriptional ArsR family regulator